MEKINRAPRDLIIFTRQLKIGLTDTNSEYKSSPNVITVRSYIYISIKYRFLRVHIDSLLQSILSIINKSIMSAECSRTADITYKVAWMKGDPKITEDAIKFWKDSGALQVKSSGEERAKMLCVVASWTAHLSAPIWA